MAETGYIRSENKLVIAGNPLDVELEVEEADMKPGMLVMRGTTANGVKKDDGTGMAIGWLGYEKSPIVYRPKNMDTAYAINARAAVLHGPGMILRVPIATGIGGSIVSGEKLVGASGGELKVWTPVPIDAASAQERIEASAVEDGSANDDYLLVRSEI